MALSFIFSINLVSVTPLVYFSSHYADSGNDFSVPHLFSLYKQKETNIWHCNFVEITDKIGQCSAGNGQWPGGQMRLIFVWGYQKYLKY